MTQPSAPAPTTTALNTAVASYAINLPSVAVGHLWLMIGSLGPNVSDGSAPGAPTTPTGWTLVYATAAGSAGTGNAIRAFCYKRVCDGSESATATLAVPSGSTRGCGANVYDIDNWFGDFSTLGFVAGTPATSNGSTTPNPPSTAWGWGTQDVMSIAVAHHAYNATILASPSGYGAAVNTQGNNSGFGGGVATAVLDISGATSPEDPGTFTLSTSRAWIAGTLVILGRSQVQMASSAAMVMANAGALRPLRKVAAANSMVVANSGVAFIKRGIKSAAPMVVANSAVLKNTVPLASFPHMVMANSGALTNIPAGILMQSAAHMVVASPSVLKELMGLRAANTMLVATTGNLKVNHSLVAVNAMVLSNLAALKNTVPLTASNQMVFNNAAFLHDLFRLKATNQMVVANSAALFKKAGLRAANAMVLSNSAAMHGKFALRSNNQMVMSSSARFTTIEIFIPLLRVRPRIYIHDGATLQRKAEITEYRDLNRSYALWEKNREAQFTLPLSSPYLELTKSKYGNVLVIESNEYPLPWVGRIVKRDANYGDGSVKIYADSYDVIMSERFTPVGYRTETEAGIAAQRLLAQINAVNGTGINLGEVAKALIPSLVLNVADGASAFDKLTEIAGLEWWLSYIYSRGEIQPYLNTSVERGYDLSNMVSLTEPFGNFLLTSWQEDNRTQAYAQTVVGGEQSPTASFSSREISTAVRDAQAIRSDAQIIEAQRVVRFGRVLSGSTSFLAPTTRRERLQFREELQQVGETSEVAQILLDRNSPYGQILGRVKPDIQGEEATFWKYLEPGNVVWLSSGNAFIDGYDGPAVITGIKPMENKRNMEIVLEIE